MLEWTAASPRPTLQLVVHHTDADREYAYDVDPVLGSRTEKVLAAAESGGWIVVDMVQDWSAIYGNDVPRRQR